jgi:hypothetical protein
VTPPELSPVLTMLRKLNNRKTITFLPDQQRMLTEKLNWVHANRLRQIDTLVSQFDRD